MKTLIFALSAAGAVLAASPAAAGDMRVEYRDLNLSTTEGRKTLERRIDAAAREVCGYGEIRTGTRLQSTQAKRCYAEAKKQAAEQFAALVAEDRLGG